MMADRSADGVDEGVATGVAAGVALGVAALAGRVVPTGVEALAGRGGAEAEEALGRRDRASRVLPSITSNVGVGDARAIEEQHAAGLRPRSRAAPAP